MHDAPLLLCGNVCRPVEKKKMLHARKKIPCIDWTRLLWTSLFQTCLFHTCLFHTCLFHTWCYIQSKVVHKMGRWEIPWSEIQTWSRWYPRSTVNISNDILFHCLLSVVCNALKYKIFRYLFSLAVTLKPLSQHLNPHPHRHRARVLRETEISLWGNIQSQCTT